MPLASGTRLGPYEIVEPIGKGGMGEVYRARDTKLERDVAIKVLPDELAADEERVARFEREAKLLASLNHPNIASIYGFESGALVLELVEGPTLAERIQQGPIPVDEAIAIAKQVVEALDAGHETGVVHRDLKPANIKLKEDGTVKVLDYGLAKALEGDAQIANDPELSQSPTLTQQGTQVGVILGTAAYMSPEQAKGKRVDKRTDIWAFGVVLFESLTGTKAFRGEDVSETLAFVLTKEPAWDALPTKAPASIRRLLLRCLAKDRRQRLADIADARLELSETTEQPVTTTPAPSRFALPYVVIGSLLLGGLITAVVLSLTGGASDDRPAYVSIHTAPHVVETSIYGDIAVSPDGTHIAYTGRPDTEGVYQLVLRSVDRFEPTILAEVSSSAAPFFSPDGEWVGFSGSEDDTLKRVSVLGGQARTICEMQARSGASWGVDGRILFANFVGDLLLVPASGGEPELLASPEGRDLYRMPELLPSGREALVTVLPPLAEAGRRAEIRVLSLDTLEEKTIVEGGTNARYMPSGHLVYGDGTGTLMAAAFDLDRLEVDGEAVPLVDGVSTHTSQGSVDFGVSANGTLAFLPDTVDPDGDRTWLSRLVWVDRDGNEQPLDAEPRAYRNPRISPDGGRMLLDIRGGQDDDIWVWDFAAETLTRLTFDPAIDSYPVWTPDGRTVVFESHRDRQGNIFKVASDGTGEVSRVTTSDVHQSPSSVSPDGEWVLFVGGGGNEHFVGIVALESDAPGRRLLQEEFTSSNGVVSPDGRWLAYQSEASGELEIYVRTFPDIDEGRWQISNRGGVKPLWAPDGQELFYLTLEGAIMSVPVETQSTFSTGKPVRLFREDYLLGHTGLEAGRSYDVDRNGSRFLMLERVEKAATGPAQTEIRLILNWVEELERAVPTGD